MPGIWDEILDEFRALGGTADNIRLGEGRFGRGLIPTDPNLPVRLHVPENLLTDVADFLGLLSALERFECAAARNLKRMARLQLQALCFAIGARAV